ncbi:sodium-independent anion transporter [Microbacterium hibisci]|uniref:sodium-independent anion transporter n=1 Tax=Microbacterium hibisci TaxID=2036000 RepID=UPI001EF252F5|nr:sodium-independent anion transporter [Microbacterium hibisci]
MAAPLFFANGTVFASAVKRAVTGAQGPVRHVVVDMEAVTDVDVTGAEAFEALEKWLDDQGIGLAFSRVRKPTRRRLEELGLLSGQTLFPTNRAAVGALKAADGGPRD